jgi:TRAP-type C4-dicarboxylate transport system substrate-binding protein
MKTIVKRAVWMFVAMAMLAGFGHLEPANAEIVWKFQSLLNPGHITPDVEIWLSKELEKRTEGEFKIQVFLGAALGFAGPRNLMTVGQGVLDSAEIWAPHVSGDYRALSIVAVAGLVPYDVPLRKKVIEELSDQQFRTLRERFNVEPLWNVQVEPRNIYTTKPVQRLSDLKGMKIRAEGITEVEFTKELGATPLSLAWNDIYTSLAQGIIDGYWVTHSGTVNARFYEHVNYCYELNIGGSNTLFIINRDKFNKLPEDYKKILKELGDEGAKKMWDGVMESQVVNKKKLQELGMTFYPVHPDDAEAIREFAPRVWDKWLEKADPEAKKMMEKVKKIVGK